MPIHHALVMVYPVPVNFLKERGCEFTEYLMFFVCWYVGTLVVGKLLEKLFNVEPNYNPNERKRNETGKD